MTMLRFSACLVLLNLILMGSAATVSPSATATTTDSPTGTPTTTLSQSPTPTNTISASGTPTDTTTASPTPTNTISGSSTPTPTPTSTATASNSPTPTNTISATGTQTFIPTTTSTRTSTGTVTNTNTKINFPKAPAVGTLRNTVQNVGGTYFRVVYLLNLADMTAEVRSRGIQALADAMSIPVDYLREISIVQGSSVGTYQWIGLTSAQETAAWNLLVANCVAAVVPKVGVDCSALSRLAAPVPVQSSSSNLSGGAVVGIVIGSVSAACIAFCLVAFIISRRRKSPPPQAEYDLNYLPPEIQKGGEVIGPVATPATTPIVTV